MTPHCSSDACGQGTRECPTRQACGLPERRSIDPPYTISGPHRARRSRSFLTAFGMVAAGFILARLVLRFFFPGVFQ